MLPFNQYEFFELFERYNEAIWPLQVFAYVPGAISVLATVSSHRFAGVICLGSLQYSWAKRSYSPSLRYEGRRSFRREAVQ